MRDRLDSQANPLEKFQMGSIQGDHACGFYLLCTATKTKCRPGVSARSNV